MGMINKVGDTISNVSKDMFDKVKSSTDATKLKQQIVYEEEKIAENYIYLGKSYYALKSSTMSENDLKACDDINVRAARIARLNIQINALKGIKVCPCCNAAITNNFLFCGLCGTKLPEDVVETTSEAPVVSGQQALV